MRMAPLGGADMAGMAAGWASGGDGGGSGYRLGAPPPSEGGLMRGPPGLYGVPPASAAAAGRHPPPPPHRYVVGEAAPIGLAGGLSGRGSGGAYGHPHPPESGGRAPGMMPYRPNHEALRR